MEFDVLNVDGRLTLRRWGGGTAENILKGGGTEKKGEEKKIKGEGTCWVKGCVLKKRGCPLTTYDHKQLVQIIQCYQILFQYQHNFIFIKSRNA